MKWNLWIAVLIVDAAVFFAWLRFFGRSVVLQADKVGAVALLISVNAFLVIKEFVIDRSQCVESPTFACLLNTNRGVWTFGALCVAAATLYVNSRMKQREQLIEEAKMIDSAMRVVSAALDELVHNLQHFANEIDEQNKFISFPATSLEATFSLLRSDVASYCSSQITYRVGNLQRITNHNKAMLRSAAELDDNLKPIALMDDEGIAVFSRSRFIRNLQSDEKSSLKSPSNGHDFGLDLVRCDKRVITHSVRCVMEIALFHKDAAMHVLRLPEFGWLTRFRSEAIAKNSYCYHTRSSDVGESEAAQLRARGSRLYCWIKDSEIDNIEIVSLRTAFKDLSHMPHTAH